jgi:hypothetical protein
MSDRGMYRTKRSYHKTVLDRRLHLGHHTPGFLETIAVRLAEACLLSKSVDGIDGASIYQRNELNRQALWYLPASGSSSCPLALPGGLPSPISTHALDYDTFWDKSHCRLIRIHPLPERC